MRKTEHSMKSAYDKINICHSGRFHSVPVLHQSASVHWHLLSSTLPLLGQRPSGQARIRGCVGLCFILPGSCPLLFKNKVI